MSMNSPSRSFWTNLAGMGGMEEARMKAFSFGSPLAVGMEVATPGVAPDVADAMAEVRLVIVGIWLIAAGVGIVPSTIPDKRGERQCMRVGAVDRSGPDNHYWGMCAKWRADGNNDYCLARAQIIIGTAIMPRCALLPQIIPLGGVE